LATDSQLSFGIGALFREPIPRNHRPIYFAAVFMVAAHSFHRQKGPMAFRIKAICQFLSIFSID